MEQDGIKYSFVQDEQTLFVNSETDGVLFEIAVVIAKNFNMNEVLRSRKDLGNLFNVENRSRAGCQNNILLILPIEMPPNKSNNAPDNIEHEYRNRKCPKNLGF